MLSPRSCLMSRKLLPFSTLKTKLELQISGLGCGYLPRYLAQRFIDSARLLKNRYYLLKAVMNRWGRLE